jgi:hypothetical protein
LTAVPYTVAYKDDLEAIAVELDAAAAAITSPDEAAFKAYLTAAAKAFRDNDWESADVAWAAMGDAGSKWYLRIGPDEVYYEPCALKAGFHVSFARINPGSVEWRIACPGQGQDGAGARQARRQAVQGAQGRLPPARLHRHRRQRRRLALEHRRHHRPVAAQLGQGVRRRRPHVVMTNLYTDADSAARRCSTQTGSLFCTATQAKMSADPAVALMTTVLHEAAHNLGPSHDYKVKGKTDDAIFGGPMAAMMEELKAQTAALYFSEWLAKARRDHRRGRAGVARPRHRVGLRPHRDRHVHRRRLAQDLLAARGDPARHAVRQRRPGVDPEDKAANGTDTGCFELDLERGRPRSTSSRRACSRPRPRATRRTPQAMQAPFVDGKAGGWADLRATITERWLRAPRRASSTACAGSVRLGLGLRLGLRLDYAGGSSASASGRNILSSKLGAAGLPPAALACARATSIIRTWLNAQRSPSVGW